MALQTVFLAVVGEGNIALRALDDRAALAADDALRKAAAVQKEDRLFARRKALENRRKRLMENLEANMREIGRTKFKTALFSFNIQKNGGLQPLVIDWAVEDIPGRYLIPQPPVPDNVKIRKLLEEKSVEWAHLEPRGESLRIR